MPGCIGHGVHPVPYPVHNSSQYQMLQGRYKYTMQREVEELVPLHWALSWVLRPREALNPTDCMWLALLPRMYSPWLRQLWIPSMNTGFFFIFFFFWALLKASYWWCYMTMISTVNLPVTGKKILPLSHLAVSSNISLFSPLKTKALSYKHADFYISLLLSNMQALLVPNFQRTCSLHENPPRHIIIPIAQHSATSLLREPGQSCTHFLQLRFQHWEYGIDPDTITLTCCKAVPTVPGPLCFAGRLSWQHSSALAVYVFPIASSTFAFVFF